ncbi:hypothetical protein [uncultured Chitinophaga sp.]|uniref:hypothetical protein n=1 Tax=uncultured Chitinophaga sp. TaxID=339340 RepID=UPI0025F4ED93|nr:hypothetical protein [uncultured Chitinophaga sp.]
MGHKYVSILLRVVLLIILCSHGFSCEKTDDAPNPVTAAYDTNAALQCEPERFGWGNGSGTEKIDNGYPYIFRKTYNAAGEPYSLQANTAANYGRHFDLKVSRDSNRVSLIRPTDGHEVLVATVDSLGRAVQTMFRSAPEGKAGFKLSMNFFYNSDGRLSKFTWGHDLHGVFNVTYDTQGNITSIADRDTTGLRFVYTYDYSQPPVKGVVYDEERGDAMIGINLLESLGYLHLRPNHLRKSAESWSGNYRLERKEYTAHVVNAIGYVTSYTAFSSSSSSHTYYTDWKCKK